MRVCTIFPDMVNRGVCTIFPDGGSKMFMEWFKENTSTLFFVVGDSHKLEIINRFHRTLKEKIQNIL